MVRAPKGIHLMAQVSILFGTLRHHPQPRLPLHPTAHPLRHNHRQAYHPPARNAPLTASPILNHHPMMIPPVANSKKKSKSKIEYKKLAFKRRRAADRQGAKGDIEVKVKPSLRERHTASSTPVSVPSFSMDAKTASKTGYVGIRDSKVTKQLYKLSEMVGEGSKFKFNLLEWDGK